MKRAIYQVCVGPKSKLYNFCRKSVKEYAAHHGIDYHCQIFPKLKIKPDPFNTNRSREAVERLGYLPIFEKANAFDLFFYDEYDQVAIIDCDVWIPDPENTPNIFDQLGGKAFGGVVEREMPITEQYRMKLINYSKMQYGNLKEVDWKWHLDFGAEFFNMGVMVMDKSITKYMYHHEDCESFIKDIRFKDFVDGVGNWKWSTDQTLYNWWVKKKQIPHTRLDWRWNALYTAVRPDKIKQAYFVHFFLKDKLPRKGENIREITNKWKSETFRIV